MIKLPREKSSSGIECFFFKIGRKGYKFYRREGTRDYCYFAQKIAYRNGIGPEPKEKLVSEFRGKTHYGYETQLAKQVSWKYYESREKQLVKELQEVYRISADCYPEDLCAPNCGKIDGRLVIIDFGHQTFGFAYHKPWRRHLDRHFWPNGTRRKNVLPR